jgi:hypothetical protein
MSNSDYDDDEALFAYAQFGATGDEKEAEQRAIAFREQFQINSHDSNFLGGVDTFMQGSVKDFASILRYDDGSMHDIIMATVGMKLPGGRNERMFKLAKLAAKLDPQKVLAYKDELKKSDPGREIYRIAKKYKKKRAKALPEITDPDSEGVIKEFMAFGSRCDCGKAVMGYGCSSCSKASSNASFAFGECKKCDNSDEPIELEPINARTQGVFLFKQNNKCWCYLVNNLYRAVFGTQIPTTIDKARVKNNKNPLNGMPIDGKILQRLVKEYAIWYKAQGKGGDVVVDGVTITPKEIEEFRNGVNTMISATAGMGARQDFNNAAKMYIEDMEELAELSDDEEAEQAKIDKAKKIAKLLSK